MITKATLMKLNKKEIEILFNSCLKGFNKTSIDPSEVKHGMFEHLKAQFNGMKFSNTDYHYNAFKVNLGSIIIAVKSGVTSTGKIIKVTKLRSKAVKTKGKFKIDFIEHGISHLSYKFINENTWKIGVEEGYISSGDPSSITLTDFDLPLKDMVNIDFLINTINEHEINNQYRSIPWKGFREELEISIAQPVIKKLFFKLPMGVDVIKKSQLKCFPKAYYDKLPKSISSKDLFTLVVKIVAEVNNTLIEDVIKNRTFIFDE